VTIGRETKRERMNVSNRNDLIDAWTPLLKPERAAVERGRIKSGPNSILL
jgi:hypothetical protein